MHSLSNIGFQIPEEPKTQPCEQAAPECAAAPVKSLAKVLFPDGRSFYYYNDLFALKRGDLVFVSGKLAGLPGHVVKVTTKFKINLSDYEKVLACPDLRIRGEYRRFKDKMISFDESAVSPEQFRSWAIAPISEEAASEVVCGEGFEVTLSELEKCEEIAEPVLSRAIGYLEEGRVTYLALRGEQGTAFVAGTTNYEVRFRLKNGTVTELYCDCPYPGLCKHAIAVLITLRGLLRELEDEDFRCLTALDADYFWDTLACTKDVIRL